MSALPDLILSSALFLTLPYTCYNSLIAWETYTEPKLAKEWSDVRSYLRNMRFGRFRQSIFDVLCVGYRIGNYIKRKNQEQKSI